MWGTEVKLPSLRRRRAALCAFKNDDINSITEWIADYVSDICLSMERNERTLNTEKTGILLIHSKFRNTL